MGVTEGKMMIAAEVDPEVKQAIQQYARRNNVSESETIRRILGLVFSFSGDLKGTKGVQNKPIERDVEL